MNNRYRVFIVTLVAMMLSACGTFNLDSSVVTEPQLVQTQQAQDVIGQEPGSVTAEEGQSQYDRSVADSSSSGDSWQTIDAVIPSGYVPYQNDVVGFRFDYPEDWYFEVATDELIYVQSFIPREAGSMGIPEGSTKIDVFIFPPGHSQAVTLEAFVATQRESGAPSVPAESQTEILSEDYWILPGDLQVVRLHTEGMFGEAYLTYAQINGYGIRLSGFGDGNVFNSIAQTLQVTGEAQSVGPVYPESSGEWQTYDLPDFGLTLSVPAAWTSVALEHWYTFGSVSEPVQLEDQLVDVGLIPPGFDTESPYPDVNSYLDYFISISEQAGFSGITREPVTVGGLEGTILWNMPDTCSQVYFEANGLLLSITFHRPMCDGLNTLNADAVAILEQVAFYPPTDPIDLETLISGQP